MRKLINNAALDRRVTGKEKVCTGRDLARILADVKLTDEEASAWHRDLQTARKILTEPRVIEPK